MTLLRDEREAGASGEDGAPAPAPAPSFSERDQPRAEAEVVPATAVRTMIMGAPASVWVCSVLGLAFAARVVNLNAFGFNSDEAVYAGQSASLAGNPLFVHEFPVFRAHPLLLQLVMSPLFASGNPDWPGRFFVACLGVLTVAVVILIGRDLYDLRTGILAGLLLAVMPYHVIITRQVLLDGPATLSIAVAFWLFIRFVRSQRVEWLLAAGGALGLAVLTKETSGILLGALVLFLLVSPQVRRPVRSLLLLLGVFLPVSLVFPVAITFAGHGSTGHNYLAWQLSRAANHTASFYLTVIPSAVGWAVVGAAAAALLFRANRTWRELLLVLWVLVPFAVFEFYPLKGYEYLVPLAPALAVLAARGLTTWHPPSGWHWPAARSGVARKVVAVVVLATLVPGLFAAVFPSAGATTALAGQGGVPGGRSAGQWVGQHLIPGTELMTIGPSMANILEYYGHRPAQGLSVSTNPLHRNPVYTPIDNPDLAVRDGQFTYLVWDAYSALRSPHTAHRLAVLVARYHGVVVHTERTGRQPLVVIYQVRP